MSKKITPHLVQHGWTRIGLPAEDLNECGAETEVSICGRLARWERSAPARGPLCAQHAAQAQAELSRWN